MLFAQPLRLVLLAGAGLTWVAARIGAGVNRLGSKAVQALNLHFTTPRAIALVTAAAGAVLIVSQFTDFRAVEIGQAGYTDSPGSATAPLSDRQVPWDVHGPSLLILGLMAGLLVLAMLRTGAGKSTASRLMTAAAIGAAGAGLLISFGIDLPRATDIGSASSAYAEAQPVVLGAFFAQVASLAALAAIAFIVRAWRNGR